jgi:plastocyanin
MDALDHPQRQVSISNFTFSPATLEVPAGTTLRWVNEDDVPHTVLGSDQGSVIRSPALDTSDAYSVVLSQPGTYHYFCSLHPHMTGTILVK